MKREIRVPYFEIGTKNYIYGDKVLEYALAADKAAEKYDIDVLFITPAVEIRRVVENTKNLIVLAPYMDTLRPGRGMADILPEGLKAAGLKSFVKEAEQTKDGFRFFFDGTWKEVSGAEEAEYFLDVCPVNSDSKYIWKAEILVKEQDGTELFGIVTAGQTGGIFYE